MTLYVYIILHKHSYKYKYLHVLCTCHIYFIKFYWRSFIIIRLDVGPILNIYTEPRCTKIQSNKISKTNITSQHIYFFSTGSFHVLLIQEYHHIIIISNNKKTKENLTQAHSYWRHSWKDVMICSLFSTRIRTNKQNIWAKFPFQAKRLRRLYTNERTIWW